MPDTTQHTTDPLRAMLVALQANLLKRLSGDETAMADRLRLIQTSATIEVAQPDSVEMQLAEAMETAGGPAMITDGKPTIMRVVAWMAHADVVNKNGAMFTKAGLESAATKIKAPDFLPMDFNHSAVRDSYYETQQKAIGVWYKAEFAFDPNANEGAGAWGILLHGMMWSWMNPAIADRLLAEQARNGKIDFSMACIASSVEFVRGENGGYEVLHDPVFFTHSALDVAPADPDAVGLGVEGSTDPEVESQFAKELTGAHASQLLAALRAAAAKRVANPTPAAADVTSTVRVAQTTTEETPMEELLAFLTANADKMADAATLAAVQTKVTEIAEAIQSNAAAAADLVTANARIAELETQLTAAHTSLETANTSIADLNAALEQRDATLAEYTAAEAKAAKEAKLAERIASLPEEYAAAHAERDDREEVEARWADYSDEQWDAFTADIKVVKVAQSYLERSRNDGGRLATASVTKGDIAKRLSQFNNN